ncbi:hypothetical protein BCV72DRAFT_246969 [Rhizopus microsporus var. microsporus]|uniref:Uncharacterized protein n=2 Tax=Rhizopus microsporus TaxID=58291 RepID=A0A2G4SUB4_RHIZD|nr:uncharacterized protein RHIMIDRAFT_238149 [Rhizopus microsporus ATCC 52813]ORE11462.1 hypothetical protein BCV72DRAFT_246969 [Rhizopus microsporus var. microsporus]PHZ12344.1 hypothetical protein RHIMIDRAFT_238149 [Rhizopus microsporus ATCC 52813]
MQPSLTLRAAHKPLIRFLGPRATLWKDAPHHSGPHPLTPPNLVKHVAQAEPQASVNKAVNSGSIEFGQLPTKYRRAVITEAEMEAIESGGATAIF